MDTRRGEEQGRSRTGGNEGRGVLLGPGPIMLAGTAIVAVVASAIWSVTARDEGSASTTGSPPPATSASATSAGGAEAQGTIYLWDPNTGEGEIVWQTPGEPSHAELRLRGERLVYASEGPDGLSQIYLQVPGETDQPLTDLGGGATEPTWSPDGSQIAFSGIEREGADADIFVMNADGSDVRTFARTIRDDGHPDWSPDGTKIVFHARSDHSGVPGGEILLASVRTGALTELPPPHPQFGEVDPAWSPDGRWIAYSRFHRSTLNGQVWKPEIWRMRPDGTERSRAGTPGHSTDPAQNPSWSPDGRFIVFQRDGGIAIVDPRTERSWQTHAFSTSAAPSWTRGGILVGLPGDPPAYPPGPVPGFEVQNGIGATIVMTVSACAVEDAPPTIRPGELTLEFVNASRLDGSFTMIRMAPGQTVADLRADPGFVASMNADSVRFVRVSGRGTWFTPQVVAGDRWAVACWRDVIAARNGFHYKPFRIVEFRVGSGEGD